MLWKIKNKIKTIAEFDFGNVGLGVIGKNLLFNMVDHDFRIAGLDLDPVKALSLESEASEAHVVKGTTSAREFIELLRRPRAIMLLVTAGKPVDIVINSLLPYLE